MRICKVSAGADGTETLPANRKCAPHVAATTESSGFHTHLHSCTFAPPTVSRRVMLRTVLKHSENQMANR